MPLKVRQWGLSMPASPIPSPGPHHKLPPLLELGHSSLIPLGQLQTHPSAGLILQQVVGPFPGARAQEGLTQAKAGRTYHVGVGVCMGSGNLGSLCPFSYAADHDLQHIFPPLGLSFLFQSERCQYSPPMCVFKEGVVPRVWSWNAPLCVLSSSAWWPGQPCSVYQGLVQ